MSYREPEGAPDDTDVLKRGKRRMFGGFVVLGLMIMAPCLGGYVFGQEGSAVGCAFSLVMLIVVLVRFASAPGHGIHGPRE